MQLPFSKSEGVRALELGVELFLLDRPLNDLLPNSDNAGAYLNRLERCAARAPPPPTALGRKTWRAGPGRHKCRPSGSVLAIMPGWKSASAPIRRKICTRSWNVYKA